MDDQQEPNVFGNLPGPEEFQSILSPEKQELKYHYITQARIIIPKIPIEYSDEKCLQLLRKHIKRTINLLTLLDRPWYQETEGIQKACLSFLVVEDISPNDKHKTAEALTQWLGLQGELSRQRGFISRLLQSYHRQLRDLNKLLSSGNTEEQANSC